MWWLCCKSLYQKRFLYHVFLSFLTMHALHSFMQDEANKTPASARHKKGCNCKRSSCLKKYCECFQVVFYLGIISIFCVYDTKSCLCIKGGVGCSISCRCEGCKNSFGRKDGKCL